MNDPGTDGAIGKAVQDHDLDNVDGSGSTSRKVQHDRAAKDRAAASRQAQDLRDPSLWWFSSTGCPLLAGTFGPLANAFSICALVQGWRVYIPPGVTLETFGIRITDPPWLLAVNALSLVCALVANTALLLNMSQKLRFKVAQPVSVIGFFMAGILLVADIAAFVASPTYHIPLDDPAAAPGAHALSSAYYFGIEAAVIYMIITVLMSFTAWGAWRGHFEGGFRLTFAQRTLMVQTMAFVVYLLLGALVFSQIEGWEYLDTYYWAHVSILTIGLGSDFAPATHTGRSLLFFFEVGGILMVGLVIGSIRTLVLDRGKRKLSARIMEKKRLRAISSINPKRKTIQVSRFSTMHFNDDIVNRPAQRELEFHVMRRIQDRAERDRKWMALLISATAALTLWLLGAVVFYHTEAPQSWSYFDSIYFSYVALLTLGYGDFYPQSYSGRAFFVLWTLLAVPTLTILISDASDTVITFFSDAMLYIGSITVLPDENGFKATIKSLLAKLPGGNLNKHSRKQDMQGPKDASESDGESSEPAAPNKDQEAAGTFLSPDSVDSAASAVESAEKRATGQGLQHSNELLMRLVDHLEASDLVDPSTGKPRAVHDHPLARDTHFYHVVLTREVRHLTRDLAADPAKRYSWVEWEYFLRLLDDEDDAAEDPLRDSDADKDGNPDEGGAEDDNEHPGRSLVSKGRITSLVPTSLRRKPPRDGATFVSKIGERSFTWLNMDSPLLSWQSETQWVLERLGVQLERELIRERRTREEEGDKAKRRKPPVSVEELAKHMARGKKEGKRSKHDS